MQDEQLQKSEEAPAKTANRCGRQTGKHPCTRQDLSAARRLQKVAINQLETAQQAVKTAQQAVETLQKVWLQEFEARGNTEEAKEAEAKVEKAKQEREKAKEEVEKAEQKYKEAQQKCEEAQAKVQAGPAQAAGLLRFCVCSCCCCRWVAALLSPLCGLAALRGVGGAFGGAGLGCFRFHASLVVLRVLPGVGAGSEVRGEGLRCSQAAVVLAYEVQVTVSVLVCLATLFCCDLLGSGTASPTVGAKQAVV